MDEKKSESRSSAADQFRAASLSLRETIKWLIAGFAAIAAAIMGAVPLVSLGSLAGSNLYVAAAAGALAVAAILVALYLALDLLLSDSFYLGTLSEDSAKDVRKKLERYQDNLVAPNFASLAQFLERRQAFRRRAQAYDGLPEERRTQREVDEIKKEQEVILPTERLIVAAGHFELLSERARKRVPWLLALALLASSALVVVAWALASKAKDSSVSTAVAVEPGKNWETIGKALALKCGDKGPIRAVLREPPRAGWAVVELQAGAECENVTITLPASIVVAPLGSAANPSPAQANP